MQANESIADSKVMQGDENSVRSSFCVASGIIVHTTTVLFTVDADEATLKDKPWPLVDLP